MAHPQFGAHVKKKSIFFIFFVHFVSNRYYKE